jgi:hypothetical protein
MQRQIPAPRIFRLLFLQQITEKPPEIKHDKLDEKANGGNINPVQPVAVI